MSKEIEERLDRLEKVAGAAGYDIHEFDSPAQAKAYTAQREAEQADEAKQLAKQQKAAAEESPSVGVPANLTSRRKPAARKPAARRQSSATALSRSTTTPVGSGK